MKKNMGSNDRLIRALIAAVIAGLYMTNLISGLSAAILLAVAAIFIVTSLVSTCPLYSLFGIRTCSIASKP